MELNFDKLIRLNCCDLESAIAMKLGFLYKFERATTFDEILKICQQIGDCDYIARNTDGLITIRDNKGQFICLHKNDPVSINEQIQLLIKHHESIYYTTSSIYYDYNKTIDLVKLMQI